MSQVALSLLWVVVVGVALVRRPTDHSVAAFAKTYAVTLTPGNVDELRSYIWWTRCWRIGGAMVVLALMISVAAIMGDPVEFSWYSLIAGYAMGALIGELVRRNPGHDGPALASMQRRTTVDFVNRSLISALVVVTGAAAFIGAWVLWHRRSSDGWFANAVWSGPRAEGPMTTWFVAALTATCVLVPAVAWFGIRRLVRAPIPAAQPDRQMVRHAIRTSAIMSVIGGATMAAAGIGLRLQSEASWPAGGDHALLRLLVVVATFVCALSVMWGALLTLTAVPRFAPLAGRLPLVPPGSAD